MATMFVDFQFLKLRKIQQVSKPILRKLYFQQQKSDFLYSKIVFSAAEIGFFFLSIVFYNFSSSRL